MKSQRFHRVEEKVYKSSHGSEVLHDYVMKNQMVYQRRSQLADCSQHSPSHTCSDMAVAAWQQCWQIAWRQVEKLHDTTDLGIAKEQVKKAKIWILDSTSLMKALNVLIEIPA